MKTKEGTLTSMRRADWSPSIGRPFAQVGPHHVVCCEPGADLASDAQDAAELARRWNMYPVLVEALERVAATREARHAVDALCKAHKGAA
ncbi:hypothetical protein B0G80_4423 [Paraburkholderia sp. BL6669N2]|uniref:hypothetical protein n=1 Tax=Paraburkholderia sp. BL6669N2 TaxID=1938807 RepID=UPI000E233BF1|nr:hypothetical protein [Paraburkholderia sp. BL6669N2]REG61570.1 hypothetical protein B0G80_4423 [Paraburkholderia sp. BL6669N2]